MEISRGTARHRTRSVRRISGGAGCLSDIAKISILLADKCIKRNQPDYLPIDATKTCACQKQDFTIKLVMLDSQKKRSTRTPNKNITRVLLGFLILNAAFLAFALINATSFSMTVGAGHLETGAWQSNDIIHAPWGSTHANGGFRGIYGGDETETTAGFASNPFAIDSARDLARLAYLTNGGRFELTGSGGMTFVGRAFRLTTSIDLSSRQWIAIGGPNREFRGAFNGAGHTITLPQALRAEVMTTNVREYGLFGRVNGTTISNLIIEGNVIYISQAAATEPRIGMVAATVQNSTIHDIASFVTIDLSDTTSTTILGGIVGSAERTLSLPALELFNLSNHGDITTGTVRSAGGIVGTAGNPARITHSGDNITSVNIFNSYNRANISAAALYSSGGLGGIVGQITMVKANDSSPAANISNVFNIGNLRVNNSSSHSRMHQIHGYRSLYIDGEDNLTSVWSLSVNNAFGVRADNSFIQNNARLTQSRENIGLINTNNFQIIGGSRDGFILLETLNSGLSYLPGSDSTRAQSWAPGAHSPTLPFIYSRQGNVVIQFTSINFGINQSQRTFFTDPETFTVGSGLFAMPSMPPDNVRFLGFATSSDLALAGVVARANGSTVTVTTSHTLQSPLRLYAVYELISPVTLTINPGDYFFVANEHRVSFQMSRTDGYTSLLSRRSSPHAVHIGWATSLERSHAGIADFTVQSNSNTYFFTSDTQLFAVWNRIMPATVMFTYSNLDMGINQPSRMVQFSNATAQINFAEFAPNPEPGFIFRGWARSPEDIARRAVSYLPTGTQTFNSSANLYALWTRIGDVGQILPPNEHPADQIPEGLQLEAPDNVAIIGDNLLVWSDISGAIGYAIYINDEQWTLVLVNFINLRYFAPGVYRIQIRALGGARIGDSQQSHQITHRVGTVTTEPAPPQREADIPEELPEGVFLLGALSAVRKVGDSVVTWGASPNAITYAIYLNGEFLQYTSYNHWEVAELMPGTYIVSVRAVGDGQTFWNSPLSAGAVFSIESDWFIMTRNQAWWQNDVVIFAMAGLLVLLSMSILISRGQLKRAYTNKV